MAKLRSISHYSLSLYLPLTTYYYTYSTMEQKKQSINPLSPGADIRDASVRQARAASMGVSLRRYETLLRNIGVNYSK